MADEYTDTLEETEETISPIRQLLEWVDMDNVADSLDEETLTKIGETVCRHYTEDKNSHDDWDVVEKSIELLKEAENTKNFPWPGAANVHYPLITTAAINYNARAYPEIVQGKDIVKATVTGEDPEGQKKDRANRVSEHMSYQCSTEMEEWEEDMDRLTIQLPIIGNSFKKTYYCPENGRNVSELTQPGKVVINDAAKSLTRAPRVSHVLEEYPWEIEEKQEIGTYRDVDLNIPQDEDETEKPQCIIEQHCLWDLDEDGKKEPWIITVHEPTKKVLRILARFDLENVEVGEKVYLKDLVEQQQKDLKMYQNAVRFEIQRGGDPNILPSPQQLDLDSMKVRRIVPQQYFTHFGFIPSPDGSLNYLGFAHLLAPLEGAIDTGINQLLDAGALENAGGGLVDGHLEIEGKKGGPIRFNLGEYKRARMSHGGKMSESIWQIPAKGPSMAMFNLLNFLIETGKEVTATKDVLVGDSVGANESPTTYLARLEEGKKVFNATFKRLHRALKDEFKKLYKLNAKYLPPQQYFTVLDDQKAVAQVDYATDDLDIQPISNPEISSMAQQIAQAQALLQIEGHRNISGEEAMKRYLEALKVPNIDAIFIPDKDIPEQPDPMMMEIENSRIEAMAKAKKVEAEVAKIVAEIREINTKAIKNLAEAEAEEIGPQMELYKAQLGKLAKELDFIQRQEQMRLINEQRQANQSRGPQVAGPAGNQQVPGGASRA